MFSMRVAVDIQFNCKTVEDAVAEFEHSCDMCSNSPQCMWHDCGSCKLAMMHEYVVSQLEAKSKEA